MNQSLMLELDQIRIDGFIKSCIRLRSVSLALWVDSYDNAKVAK